MDFVRNQYKNKLASQVVREKSLIDRKSEMRIREAQLEYNETRFSERIAQEVELRVQARLANRPEPPALAPIFFTLSSRLTTGRYVPVGLGPIS